MVFIEQDKLLEYILSKVSEVDIISFYTGISVSDIEYSLSNKSFKLNSPLRYDNNPSVSFKYKNKGTTSIIMVDWADNSYSGDFIHIVGIVKGLNCNNKKQFTQILNDIINEFIDSKSTFIISDIHKPVITNVFTNIEIKVRELTYSDFKYFNQYKITQDTVLKENILGIDRYWVNEKLNSYRYSSTDPAYCYILDKEVTWLKLYFPLRSKVTKFSRFITNYPLPIERIDELVQNKVLIITKSIKDKILLKQIIQDLNITCIEVTNVSSENIRLSSDYITLLSSMYSLIFTGFDNDYAGKEAKNYYSNYNMKPLQFYSNSIFKDITDYSKSVKYGTILEEFYTEYINKMI